MQEAHVDTRGGRLWARKPPEGLPVLLRIVNRKRRPTDTSPVSFTCAAFSGDGRVAAGVDRQGHVYFFYLTLNRFVLALSEGSAGRCCAFTRRAREELLVGFNRMVRVIDGDSHRVEATLSGHGQAVRSIACSGLKGAALTLSHDVAILWDLKDWTKMRSLFAQESPLAYGTFSPSGDAMVTVCSDGTASVWEASPSGRLRRTLKVEQGLEHVSVDDQRIITCGSKRQLFIWQVGGEQQLQTVVDCHRPVIQAELGVSNVGRRVQPLAFVLEDDGSVRVTRLQTLEVAATLDAEGNGRVVKFAVDPMSRHALLITSAGALELCDIEVAVARAEAT
jgi:WD40 repeat protein